MSSATARRRLLFLLPFPPRADGTHGASTVSGQLLERLAERHDVAALHLRAPGEAPIDAGLADRLAHAEEVPRADTDSTALRRGARTARGAVGLLAGRPAWASDWRSTGFARRALELSRSWRPEIVQAELHVMAQYLPAAGEGARTVLVEHEPGAAAAADLAAWERGVRGAARRLDLLAWRRYEQRALAAADAVVAFSDQDRAALAELAPAARIVRISPGARLAGRALDPIGSGPPRILFFGNFVHPPNVDAALRLARDIFPAVKAGRPDAKLEIVGANPPPALRRLAGETIEITGAVEDVEPYLERAAVLAVPLRLGGGVRVKVLEGLSAGKAIVATPRALAGVDLAPGEHALVAETDAELSEAVLSLLGDRELRARIGRAARAWASDHLRWEDTVSAYESLYDSLLEADQRPSDETDS